MNEYVRNQAGDIIENPIPAHMYRFPTIIECTGIRLDGFIVTSKYCCSNAIFSYEWLAGSDSQPISNVFHFIRYLNNEFHL